MTIVLQVPDEKAPALLEVLEGIPFVKVKPSKTPKAQFLEDLQKAVEEVNLVKARKKARSAKAFLNAL